MGIKLQNIKEELMGQKEGECGESQSEMELMRSLERCKKYKDQKKFMN